MTCKKSIGNCITIFCTVFAGIMLQSRDMKVRVVMFIFSTQSSPTTQVTRPRQIMETILAASRPSMSQYYVTILCHDNITQQHEVSRSHDPPARLTKLYWLCRAAGQGRAGCRVQTVHCTAALQPDIQQSQNIKSPNSIRHKYHLAEMKKRDLGIKMFSIHGVENVPLCSGRVAASG